MRVFKTAENSLGSATKTGVHDLSDHERLFVYFDYFVMTITPPIQHCYVQYSAPMLYCWSEGMQHERDISNSSICPLPQHAAFLYSSFSSALRCFALLRNR